MTRRRINAGRPTPVAPPPPAAGRRRRARAAYAELAGAAVARRFRLSAFARVYAAAALVLAFALGYLVVATQATQTSYELSRLKDQNSQLQAQEDQLRYRVVSQHTPARVAQQAAQAGLQRTTPAKYVAYQPTPIDLGAPTGADRPDPAPLWQRALAAVLGGAGRDALATDR